jgi:hypothetical protein
VLLSTNETFADGPAQGLRLVETRRSAMCLSGLLEAVQDLRELVVAGQRDELKQRCVALAERLQ